MSSQRKLALGRFVRSLLFLPVATLHASAPADANTTPAPTATTIQAKLMASLDVTRVHPGSKIFATVQTPWTGGGCVLNEGSVIAGRVAGFARRSKTDKSSSVDVLFDGADCKGNPGHSPHFALLALVGPGPGAGGTRLDNGLPLAVPSGMGRSISTAASVAGSRMIAVRNLPTHVMPGDVLDVPKTRLDTPKDDGETRIIATGKDLRLEAETLLILRARLGASAGTAPGPAAGTAGTANNATPDPASSGGDANAAAASAPPPPPPEPPDVTDLCASGCTLLGKDAGAAPVETKAAGSVSLRNVGLLPASNRELARFTQDTNVVYLDATHLLCTFDPRHLRERTETEGEPSRLIRAVVVSTTDYKIQRVLEWHVRGSGQYLWQLSSGHLLVHLGRELRELDTDLKPVRSYHLNGRLAWVVSSPSGTHIAIGTVLERYSDAMRLQLQEAMSAEPEEDIDVRVYGEDHHEILNTVRSSLTPPPVLSDGGELRVEHDARDRWKITEIDWQQHEHLLANTHSSCRPLLSVPHADLIFMLGCTGVGSHWYRMLHADGHPVLKAESARIELGHRAQASGDGAFAVRIVEGEGIDPTQPFRPSSLKQERITVYSSANGSRLSSLAASDFLPTEQGFALSPSGNQIALVGSGGLYFYPLNRAAE